jgi:23S rRNA pseudouridine955/2504/2580 synthase
MDFMKFSLTDDDADRRMDRIVRRFLPTVPLSGIYQLMRKGLIRLDGKKVEPAHRSQAGSELWIAHSVWEGSGNSTSRSQDHASFPTPKPSKGIKEYTPEVLFEDSNLLFVNKSAGIAVHGDSGLDTLIPQAKNADASLSFRTGPLHRLDKGTTGILAFSRSLTGARWFSLAIMGHEFEKYYLGIAEGEFRETETWTDTEAGGKAMVTVALPLAHAQRGNLSYTLVRYRIITGRKHQIRMQTALHGHPLMGDSRYGSTRREDGSYYLHARELVFPADRPQGLPDRLFAPIPERFARKIVELFGAESLAELERGVVYWKDHDEHQ